MPWIPDSLSVEPGFRMPIVNGISDSLTCIPDSKAKDLEFTSKNFPDSGFHEQKFPGFWISRAKISWFPDSTSKNLPDSGLHEQKFAGFRISRAKFPGFRIPQAKISRIPRYTSKIFPDSRFHDQKFPRRIPESRFSDMEWPNQGLARVNMHLSIHPSWNS